MLKFDNPSIAAMMFGALFFVTATAAQADSTPASVETAGGLKVKSAERDFSFELGGEIWIDKASYQQDDALGNNATGLDDGMELRRARLSLEGTLYDDWGYAAEYDMSSSEAKDMYLEYTGLKGVDIKLGNFKEPFSMEDMTSGKAITFMERALPVDTFAPGRNLGVGAFAGGKRWSASAGVFGEAYDSDIQGDDGWGTTVRGTYSPKLRNGPIVHLGASLSRRSPPKEDSELRFRDGLESHVADQELLDTGNGDIADVNKLNRTGLEAALVYNHFSVQWEHISVNIDRAASSGPDLEFSGWYLAGSWVLTGESRSYNGAKGRLNRIKPKGRDTAWEIALRTSHLDLSDEDIEGGELKNTTLAVNAYVNDNVRFRINMIQAKATPNEDGNNEKVGILQLRGELYF